MIQVCLHFDRNKKKCKYFVKEVKSAAIIRAFAPSSLVVFHFMALCVLCGTNLRRKGKPT